MLNIEEIIKASNSNFINGKEDLIPISYNIDSRLINSEDFFIPISGENVDGHEFIIDTVKKGAIGFFISSNYKNKEKIITESIKLNSNICILEVKDTLKALCDIAEYNREKHINIPLVAITGSVGKTSTREMVASVLSEKYNLLVTERNFNSIIGLPLMLLKLENQEVCVLEAGVDFLGEMESLSKMMKPDICIVTNIGIAHIKTMGSKDNIYNEKIKIIDNIKGAKKLILNGDDKYLCNYENKNIDVIKYTLSDISNKNFKNNFVEFSTKIYDRKCNIRINQIGNHNIQNSLPAIKTAEILNLSIDEIIKGIGKYRNFSGRFEIKNLRNDVILVDDTYNALVDSMKSGLITVDNMEAKRKIAVLGDMLNLGEYSKESHIEVGEFFKELNYSILYIFGEEAKNIALVASKYIDDVRVFDDKYQLIDNLKQEIKSGDILYFKASNAMKFGEIVKELEIAY